MTKLPLSLILPPLMRNKKLKIVLFSVLGLALLLWATLWGVEVWVEKNLRTFMEETQRRASPFGVLVWKDVKVEVIHNRAYVEGPSFKWHDKLAKVVADRIYLTDISLYEIYNFDQHRKYPGDLGFEIRQFKFPFKEILPSPFDFVKNLELDDVPLHLKVEIAVDESGHISTIEPFDFEAENVFHAKGKWKTLTEGINLLNAEDWNTQSEDKREQLKNKLLNTKLLSAHLFFDDQGLAAKIKKASEKTFHMDILSILGVADGFLKLLKINQVSEVTSNFLHYLKTQEDFELTLAPPQPIELQKFKDIETWLHFREHLNPTMKF